MSLPIFSGYAVQNRIAETAVLEDKARSDLDAALRSVNQATRTAFNLLSGLAQVRALEAAEASSQLALEATQLGYRVGVRVNLDVLNVQTLSSPPGATWPAHATTCCWEACACARPRAS